MSDAFERVRNLYGLQDPTPDEFRPSSVDDARQWLRSVDREEAGVLIVGQGRHSHRGATPRGITHILNLSSLDRVVDYSPADMTLQVEAGCPIAEIRRLLDRRRQCLPFLPCDDGGTIGGLVAAGVEGPWASMGRIRDSLIGIQVLLPEGILSHAGGQVVKNVAGYDLCKLHVGALGTLGVITRLTFKVRSAPRRHRTLLFGPGRLNSALVLARSIRDAVLPAALSIDASRPEEAVVRAGLLDDPAASKWKVARSRREAEPERILEDEDSQGHWRAAEDRFEAPGFVGEVFSRLTDLEAGRNRIREHLGDADVELCFLRGRTLLRLPDERIRRPDFEAAWETFRNAPDPGSSVSIRSAPHDGLRRFRSADLPNAMRVLHRLLRRSFDPNGILNPGRVP